MSARDEIRGIVDRETRAWNTGDADLLVSIFHPDMVWPWPPTNTDHDPATWVLPLGRFDRVRWKAVYEEFFARKRLVHNRRTIAMITVSAQEDGGFAVVDIDTLWEDVETGGRDRWLGRVCKVYAKTDGGWKMTMHTGVLDYGTGRTEP